MRALGTDALHLSVAAGIPSDSIARWLGTERVVRAMPNTPALVGQGMTGLFARPAVDAAGRKLVEQVLDATGDLLWVDAEGALDAVTAVSGSGPAYVFYFIEAMTEAGVELGLSPEQAHRLAVGTFSGASALARQCKRAACGAARARDLQGRHHLRGDHFDGEGRRQGEVQGRDRRRIPARRRTRQGIRPGLKRRGLSAARSRPRRRRTP